MYDDFEPVNNPIHALRLEFGDTDEMDYILSDQSYQYFINTFTSPRVLRKKLGWAILGKFATEGYRQRVGQEEAYLGERYTNYREWLKEKVTNPMVSGNLPKVYVGGVDRETVADYETRMDLIDSTFYKGQRIDRPDWKNYRKFERCTTLDPEEKKNFDCGL